MSSFAGYLPARGLTFIMRTHGRAPPVPPPCHAAWDVSNNEGEGGCWPEGYCSERQPFPTDTRASDWDQSTIVFKTTAPPRNKTKVAGVTHVGPEFCCGSPAAARTVNAAGRAVAIEAGILTLDAEVREGGGDYGARCEGGGGRGGVWGWMRGQAMSPGSPLLGMIPCRPCPPG